MATKKLGDNALKMNKANLLLIWNMTKEGSWQIVEDLSRLNLAIKTAYTSCSQEWYCMTHCKSENYDSMLLLFFFFNK